MRIIHEALTFDDVLLQPAYSDVLPRDVELHTRLTRDLVLNIPIVSAAMDSVTEARLAIALAQEGGIGIIHKNMAPSEQANQVRSVKKFESGIVSDPITVAPDTQIRDVIDLTRARRRRGSGRYRDEPRFALRDSARRPSRFGDDAEGSARHGP
jgi:IMP dehydrogenase